MNLWIGNTGVLEVLAVKDKITGDYINDAALSATIKTQAGVLIATISPQYVEGSNGDYQGTIAHGISLVKDQYYIVEVTADAGGGLVALWSEEVPARQRGFGE